jgi:hypothetical protein
MKRIGVALSSLAMAALLVWVVWSPALGQPGQAGRRPSDAVRGKFIALNKNKDGVVTREEFMAVRHPGGRGEDVFSYKDVNGDGKITKEEFCSRKGSGPGKGVRPSQ